MRTTGRVVGHSRSCKCCVRAGCSAPLYGGAVTALSFCTQLLAPKLSPRTTVVCRTTGRPPDRHGLFVTRPSSRAGVTAVDCRPCDLVAVAGFEPAASSSRTNDHDGHASDDMRTELLEQSFSVHG